MTEESRLRKVLAGIKEAKEMLKRDKENNDIITPEENGIAVGEISWGQEYADRIIFSDDIEILMKDLLGLNAEEIKNLQVLVSIASKASFEPEIIKHFAETLLPRLFAPAAKFEDTSGEWILEMEWRDGCIFSCMDDNCYYGCEPDKL